jgi:hypothetical protein
MVTHKEPFQNWGSSALIIRLVQMERTLYPGTYERVEEDRLNCCRLPVL